MVAASKVKVTEQCVSRHRAVSDKIKGIIGNIQTKVDQAIDKLIARVMAMFQGKGGRDGGQPDAGEVPKSLAEPQPGQLQVDGALAGEISQAESRGMARRIPDPELQPISPSPRRFFNDVYAYGNQVSRPGHQQTPALFDGDRGWWDEHQHFVLDVHHPRLRLRDGPRMFTISDLDYTDRGIAMTHNDQKPIGLLRYLGEVILDELFVPSEALLDCCGRQRTLHQILALDDWQHPDLAEDELPSSSALLRQIAEVLASGETSLPGDNGNTDWRRWT